MSIVRTACVAAVLALAGLQGCNKHETASGDPATQRTDLTLETSQTNVVVGDTTTVTARSQDTYGRNADVKWSTTGGKLSTEEHGRVARVKFDKPGTYTVTAMLMVDGKEAKRDSVDIHVKPVS